LSLQIQDAFDKSKPQTASVKNQIVEKSIMQFHLHLTLEVMHENPQRHRQLS
jgi:hypothetical protein